MSVDNREKLRDKTDQGGEERGWKIWLPFVTRLPRNGFNFRDVAGTCRKFYSTSKAIPFIPDIPRPSYRSVFSILMTLHLYDSYSFHSGDLGSSDWFPFIASLLICNFPSYTIFFLVIYYSNTRIGRDTEEGE